MALALVASLTRCIETYSLRDAGRTGDGGVQADAPDAPDALASCSATDCGTVCASGHADCNGSPADGCEVDLETDVSDCGACGHVCASGTVCTAGVCVATCTNPVCPGSPTAYDGFDYMPGALVSGLNGGTGWNGPWTHTASYAGEMYVVSGGFTYPGLPTTGQRIEWFDGSPLAEEQRMLPRQSCGSVYLQFIARFEPISASGAPTVRLIDSTATNACGIHINGGVGGNSTVDGTHICILGTTPTTTPYPCNVVPNQPPPAPSSCTSALLSSVNLVVTRIDYSCTPQTRMWVNPDLSTFNYASPPPPDAQWLGLAPTFDTLDIFYHATGSIDEIRVFPAPSP